MLIIVEGAWWVHSGIYCTSLFVYTCHFLFRAVLYTCLLCENSGSLRAGTISFDDVSLKLVWKTVLHYMWSQINDREPEEKSVEDINPTWHLQTHILLCFMGITLLTNWFPGTPFSCTLLLCSPQRWRHQLGSTSDHRASDSYKEWAASDPGTHTSQKGSRSCDYLMPLVWQQAGLRW